jgi:hypothetical protein
MPRGLRDISLRPTEELWLIKMQKKKKKTLNISTGPAYVVEHDNLQFHKVCARGLTDEYKCMCLDLDVCSCHLVLYEKGNNFLQDETSPSTKINWKNMQCTNHLPPPALEKSTCNH